MRESVIWYRGAGYQLGRGPLGYAVWPAGGPPDQPLEQWPETPAGWSAAWSRFNAVQPPGSIVHLGPPAGPAAGPPPAGPPAAGPLPGPAAGPPPGPAAGRPGAAPGSWRPADGPSWRAANSSWPAGSRWSGLHAAGPLSAAILLVTGVVCGLASLFPAYLSGASLAQEPPELVPHVIYLAVWAASAVLIVSGGVRQRMGALLALGMSIVTFGFFFSDLGTVLSGGAHLLGPGLVLGLAGWLACTAGSVLAFRLRAADAPRKLDRRQRSAVVTLTIAALAAIGTAVAFAPSWDSYTLRAASGVTQTLTAGNAFANPGPVIVGDVAVMIALVVVVAFAALWRPVRLGAVLLAGAAIPMAAQAISALVEVSEPVSATSFGISPAQAARLGLTVSAGVTPAFWIYCAFVVALLMVGGWMALPQRAVSRSAQGPAGGQAPWPGQTPWPGTADSVTAGSVTEAGGQQTT